MPYVSHDDGSLGDDAHIGSEGGGGGEGIRASLAQGLRSLQEVGRGSVQEDRKRRSVHQVVQKGGGTRPVFADAEAMKEKLRENMMRPQYDVTKYYKSEGLFQQIARSQAFGNVTLLVIGINAIWIWVDTDFNHADALMEAEWPFQLAEHMFCMYFSFEWLVRFMSFVRKRDGLRDAWFCFDSVMVFMMVTETWLMTLMLIALSPQVEDGGVGMSNGGLLRILRLLRLSRMARMARLLRAMPELLILIKGMMAAVRSVVFTLLLLLIVLYVFGIAFVQLLTGVDENNHGFRTVPEAMHTLLLKGTLMDEIGLVVRQLGRAHILYVAVFYFFVLISALTVMNMLIGVLCEVVNAVAAAEREELTVTYVRSKLQETLRQGGLDTDGDGMISKEEFAQILDNAHAARTLADVGVDVFNLVDLQEFIFEDDDENGEKCEKQLTFGEFMEVVLQLRGSNQATVKDIVDLRKFFGSKTKELEQRILGCFRDNGVSVRSLKSGMSQGNGSSASASFNRSQTDPGLMSGNSHNNLHSPRGGSPAFCKASGKFEDSCSVWRVVSEEPVNVRKERDLLSGMLGRKAFGEQVRGFDVGGWIELADEPGYIVKRRQGIGEPLLEQCTAVESAMAKAHSNSTRQLLDRLEDELRSLRHTFDTDLSQLERGLVRSIKRAVGTPSCGHDTYWDEFFSERKTPSAGNGRHGKARLPDRGNGVSGGYDTFEDGAFQLGRGRRGRGDPTNELLAPPKELLAPALDDEDDGLDNFIVPPSDSAIMKRSREGSPAPRM